MVDLLLTKKNINPFVEDNEGKTSLDYAKEGKKAEILQALINNKYGSEQDSLYQFSLLMNQIRSIAELFNRGRGKRGNKFTQSAFKQNNCIVDFIA